MLSQQVFGPDAAAQAAELGSAATAPGFYHLVSGDAHLLSSDVVLGEYGPGSWFVVPYSTSAQLPLQYIFAPHWAADATSRSSPSPSPSPATVRGTRTSGGSNSSTWGRSGQGHTDNVDNTDASEDASTSSSSSSSSSASLSIVRRNCSSLSSDALHHVLRSNGTPSYLHLPFSAAASLAPDVQAQLQLAVAGDAYPLFFFSLFPAADYLSGRSSSSWRRTLCAYSEMSEPPSREYAELMKRANVVRQATLRNFTRSLWNSKLGGLFDDPTGSVLQDYQVRLSFGGSPAKFDSRLALTGSHLVFIANLLGSFVVAQLHYANIVELEQRDSSLRLVFAEAPSSSSSSSSSLSSGDGHGPTAELFVRPPKHSRSGGSATPAAERERLLTSDLFGVLSSLRARNSPGDGALAHPSELHPPHLFPAELCCSLFDWATLLSGAVIKKFRDGDVLQAAEHSVRRLSVIVRGKALISSARSSTKLTLHTGDLYGDHHMLFGRRSSYTLMASGSCQALQLKCQAVEQLFEARPALRARFYASLVQSLFVRSLLFDTSVPPSLPRLMLPRRSRSGHASSSSSASAGNRSFESGDNDDSGDTSASGYSEADESKAARQKVWLSEFRTNSRVHLQRYLGEGSKEELAIFALLHPYLFASTADFIDNVVSLGPAASPERFLFLANATIRYHWNLVEDADHETCFATLLQRCEDIAVDAAAAASPTLQPPSTPSQSGSSSSLAVKNFPLVADMKADLIANQSAARSRCWNARPATSASGLLAFLDMHTCFEEIKPADAAHVLAFLDWKFFSAIPITEFMKKSFQDKQHAPVLHQSIARFNTMTNWIVTMILTPEERSQRAWNVQRWIKIAQCLKDLNDFSGLQMVSLALDHVYVSRLKATWELVPADAREQFRALAELVTPHHNYGNYRRLCKKTPNYIPIIPVFTKDLFQIEDREETFLNDSDLNFNKLVSLYGLLNRISELQTSLELQYKDFKVESVKRRFFEKMEGVIENEDDLYALSIKREPAGGQSPAAADQHGSSSGNLLATPGKRKVFGKKSASFRSPSSNVVVPVETGQPGVIPLRVCIKGTTPAFIELGLSLVNKTVLLSHPLQDPKEVLQLLLDRVCSTMRQSQIDRVRAESKWYALYEEKDRGKMVAITAADKPWPSREAIVFERDRSMPKLKKSTIEIMRLQYHNAMLQDKLNDAYAEIAKLKGTDPAQAAIDLTK